MTTKNFISTSPTQTRALGRKTAQGLKGGEIITLTGNLGSGKTTFLKGLAKGLGVKEIITSPTFVLMKVYSTRHKTVHTFVHVDCYRLPVTRLNSSKSSRHSIPGIELATIGLDDYLNKPNTVVAIEWANKLHRNLKPTLQLMFKMGKQPSQRVVRAKRSTVGKIKILF